MPVLEKKKVKHYLDFQIIKMKPVIFFSVCLLFSFDAFCQQSLLQRQLKESQHLRFVMKPDAADMGMTRWRKKKVFQSRSLPLATDFAALKNKGPGTLKVDKSTSLSGSSVVIDAPSSLEKKNPSNRSYAFAEMIRPLDHEDLRKYNRISV